MRGSVFNLIRLLESRGFICISKDFKTTDDSYGLGIALLCKDTKCVSIMVTLYGITVIVSTQKYKDHIVVNQRQVLTEVDLNRVLFYLN